MPRANVLSLFEPKLFLALGGPLLLGVLPGLRLGVRPTLQLGPTLVLSLLVTVATMGPALYLLWGLTGARGTFKQMGASFVDALTAAGQIHLGLAPVVLLLAATVADPTHAVAFAVAAFAGGLLVGATRLWRALRTGASVAHTAAVLIPWMGASLLLGGRVVGQLFIDILRVLP